MTYSIVVPTIGRASLCSLLDSLERANARDAEEIILVDDRKQGAPLNVGERVAEFATRIKIVCSGGRGPAAARNAGWRASTSEWICFLDDDVVVDANWAADLRGDLADAGKDAGGIQAQIDVPLPVDRSATDWERNVGGLATSSWITADMAYRRTVLEQLQGFDERFKRAYREDADLAIRAQRAGYTLETGRRHAYHPVQPASRWISVKLQRGNADDVLMRALHGPQWRTLARSPRGRFPLHAATVLSAGIALAAALERRRPLALSAAAIWLGLTADFAWRRIAPGPRTVDEIATMAATSAAIPFAAVYHKVRGFAKLPSLLREDAA